MASMRCEVAREALSARIDGEPEGAVRQQVDDHLENCRDCCAWYVRGDLQSRELRALGAARAPDLSALVLGGLDLPVPGRLTQATRKVRASALRGGLVVCGVAQLCVAFAQLAGYEFGHDTGGQVHDHGHGHAPEMTSHIMNETTAWALALGVCMVVAGFWRRARAGLAVVLAVFAVALAYYVLRDAMASEVTVARIASHLPVFLGALFALALVRGPDGRRPDVAGEVRPAAPLRPVRHDSAA